MHCAYCGGKDPFNDKRGFMALTVPFCSFDCYNAYGIRKYREFHKLPYDPDQLNLGIAEHDPYWDVERWKCLEGGVDYWKEK